MVFAYKGISEFEIRQYSSLLEIRCVSILPLNVLEAKIQNNLGVKSGTLKCWWSVLMKLLCQDPTTNKTFGKDQ
jgi:hypothetical protein